MSVVSNDSTVITTHLHRIIAIIRVVGHGPPCNQMGSDICCKTWSQQKSCQAKQEGVVRFVLEGYRWFFGHAKSIHPKTQFGSRANFKHERNRLGEKHNKFARNIYSRRGQKYIYAEGFFSRPHYHCAEWHRNRGPPSRHDHFQRFPTILEFCRPDKRVLCVLDKASCHLSVKAINICIKHNIDLLAVPPNCTNFLQSFDQIGLV